jgi:hypothetical protein
VAHIGGDVVRECGVAGPRFEVAPGMIDVQVSLLRLSSRRR